MRDAATRPHHTAGRRTLNARATLRPVQTFGRTPARHEVYRGLAYTLDTASELEVAFLVHDEVLESAILTLAAVIGDREILLRAKTLE